MEVIVYPVFFVARQVTQRVGEGLFFTDLVMRTGDVDGRAVVLFTSREAAEGFRDAHAPGLSLFAAYTPGDLIDHLIAARRAVASHAVFDPAPAGAVGPVYVSLDDLLARVRGQGRYVAERDEKRNEFVDSGFALVHDLAPVVGLREGTRYETK